jgi:hypothetical protein
MTTAAIRIRHSPDRFCSGANLRRVDIFGKVEARRAHFGRVSGQTNYSRSCNTKKVPLLVRAVDVNRSSSQGPKYGVRLRAGCSFMTACPSKRVDPSPINATIKEPLDEQS